MGERQQSWDQTGLVSVVVPVHDRFDLAHRAVKSVVAQTYRPVELVVVDDGSCESFRPDLDGAPWGLQVHVVRHEHPLGPGGARESGRQALHGSYVAYLDSDDYWSPKYLEAAVSVLAASPDVGMAYCTALDVEDEEARAVCKRSSEEHSTVLPTILWGRPWHTSGCLWRRSVTDRIGPWLPLRRWEDYEYDCRAGCLDTRIAHVPEPLCFVQRDAPGRLSESCRPDRAGDFATALLSMSQHLQATRFASDLSVRSRLTELLLSAAIECTEARVHPAARSCLIAARSWSMPQPCALIGLYTAILLVAARQSSLGARVLRRLRHALAANPAHTAHGRANTDAPGLRS